MSHPTNKPIIAVGDLVWDVLVKPDTVLLPGGDTTGRIALSPGGSAANVAAWLARVGAPAGFAGSVGADVLGDLIAADLAREGVACHITRIPERDTGVVLVLIDRDGQRSMVTNQGADFALLPEHLPEAALRGAAHVHLTAWSLFTDPPRAAALRAAAIATAGGANISLDPGSHQMIRQMGVEEFERLIAGMSLDLIFPNRDEAAILSGERDPERMARAIRRRHPEVTVVLKLDRDGCYVLAGENGRYFPTQEVAAVDATGAGDAFNAAFLARYLRGGDIATAARFANAVAGWVITRYGARPPVDETLRALVRTMGDQG